MKTLTITSILTILLITPSLEAQIDYNKIIKGRVKTITETYFQMLERPGRLDSVSAGKVVVTIDTLGKIISQYRYSNSGKTIRKFVPVYDKTGLVIEEKEYLNGELKLTTIPEYNNKVKISQKTFRPDNSLNFTVTFKYNDKGRMEEMNYQNNKGKSYSRHTYGYDSDGNMVLHKSYRGDGSLISSDNVKYGEYDKIGNWHRSLIPGNEDRPGFLTLREIEYYE